MSESPRGSLATELATIARRARTTLNSLVRSGTISRGMASLLGQESRRSRQLDAARSARSG